MRGSEGSCRTGGDIVCQLESVGCQFAQVRLRELNKFFSAAGQDGPGRVQGEALDLAEGEGQQLLPAG
jgi:hypothetical protein